MDEFRKDRVVGVSVVREGAEVVYGVRYRREERGDRFRARVTDEEGRAPEGRCGVLPTVATVKSLCRECVRRSTGVVISVVSVNPGVERTDECNVYRRKKNLSRVGTEGTRCKRRKENPRQRI